MKHSIPVKGVPTLLQYVLKNVNLIKYPPPHDCFLCFQQIHLIMFEYCVTLLQTSIWFYIAFMAFHGFPTLVVIKLGSDVAIETAGYNHRV